MEIILKGEPKSTQSIYKATVRGHFPCVYMTKEGKDLKEYYQIQARIQHKADPTPDPVEIEVKLYFGTKRKSDWDNFHKLSMDALTDVVWIDDSQIQKATVYKLYDRDNPRIEIKIDKYNEPAV